MRIALLAPSVLPSVPEVASAILRNSMEVINFYGIKPTAALDAAHAYVLLTGSDTAWTSPGVEALLAFLQAQSNRGKVILGLGYASAKLLAESGLVPGLFKNQAGLEVVQTEAVHRTAADSWIRLSDDYQLNAFTRIISPRQCLPVSLSTSAAFIIPPALRTEIEIQGLNIFLYCDTAGNPLTGEPSIAALANKAGNVMAMVPELGEPLTGDLLFQSLHKHLSSGPLEQVEPLYYWPRR